MTKKRQTRLNIIVAVAESPRAALLPVTLAEKQLVKFVIGQVLSRLALKPVDELLGERPACVVDEALGGEAAVCEPSPAGNGSQLFEP
jgi:hypothetical protein